MKLAILSFIICLLLQHNPPPPVPQGFDRYSVYVIENSVGDTPNNALTKIFNRGRLRKSYDAAFNGGTLRAIRGFSGYSNIVDAIENGIILVSRNGEWIDIVNYTANNFPGTPPEPSAELIRICGLALSGSAAPGSTTFVDSGGLCNPTLPLNQYLPVILVISLLVIHGCNNEFNLLQRL